MASKKQEIILIFPSLIIAVILTALTGVSLVLGFIWWYISSAWRYGFNNAENFDIRTFKMKEENHG